MDSKLTADWLIAHFHMRPLVGEGGVVYQSYFSDETLPEECLPGRIGDRKMCSAIIYLLTPNTFSRMHRLVTDEIFHFYMGTPVEMLQLHPDGSEERLIMGHDLLNGERVQVTVPRGSWQGTRLIGNGGFALLGTSMAPSFAPEDYENGIYEKLALQYTQHLDLLRVLCGEPKYF